ncbi:MAG TPA: cytochrome c-type biogenesis protein CcmH [Acidobacteriaceae bacterium]|jgi:cytochrome c-type biogenesis protein CcmH|nr:cytochrome c-type biogenesis protein CcmH [Acidobacteriaceae bacterium]
MRRLAGFTLLPLLVVLGVLTLGSTDTQSRFDDLGHKLMCTCGCGQVLLECNHLGCQSLATESAELQAAVAKGATDNAILIAFQNEYGPTVLAAPMLTKFNILAWVVPPAFLLLGIAGTIALVRKWRLRTATMPAVADDPESRELRERIRKETEV